MYKKILYLLILIAGKLSAMDYDQQLNKDFASKLSAMDSGQQLGCNILLKNLIEVLRLLEQKANPNVQFAVPNTQFDAKPIFTWAVQSQDIKIVQALLDAQADPNMPDRYGQTSFRTAVMCQDKELCKLLLTAQADPNFADATGGTALMNAAFKCDAELVQILLDGKADPNMVNWKKETALIIATRGRKAAVMQTLLNAQAEALILDNNDQSALMHAAATYSVEHKDIEPLNVLLNGMFILDYRHCHAALVLQAERQGFVKICNRLKECMFLPAKLTDMTEKEKIAVLKKIIKADLVPHFRQLLTLQMLQDDNFSQLIVPGGFIERFIQNYKEKFLTLFLIFNSAESASKTWSNFPIKLLGELLTYDAIVILPKNK